MPRHEVHVVAQRKQFRANRVHELGKIPIAMFPGTYRVPEQDVAYEGEFPVWVVVSDVALGVSGTMEYANTLGTESDDVVVFQPAIGRERLSTNAEALALLVEGLQQVLVGLMRALDPCSSRRGECRSAASVIHMPMRHQYHFEFDFLPL